MRTDTRNNILVFLLFSVLTLILTYPIITHISRFLPGYYLMDPILNIYILKWDAMKLLSDPLNLFQASIYYPYSNTLAYSECLIGLLPLYFAVSAVTGDPVAIYNIIILLAYLLSAYGMYLLVKNITGKVYPGIIAGIIFSYSTCLMGLYTHIQVLSIFWSLFMLLFLKKYFESGKVNYFALSLLFFVLQVLSCWYIFFQIAIMYFLFFLCFFIFKKSFAGAVKLKHVISGVLIAFIVILVFALPYYEVRKEIPAFKRSMEEVAGFSPSPGSYLSVPSANLVYSKLLKPFRNYIFPEEEVFFPGFIPLALFIAGSFLILKKEKKHSFFIILGIVGFILSLGPFLHIGSRMTDIPLPYAVLYYFVPGFGSMRFPSRFVLSVMISISVISGYAISKINIGKSGLLVKTLAVILPVFIILEHVMIPLQEQDVSRMYYTAPVYEWLKSEKGDFGIFEAQYPLSNYYDPEVEAEYGYFSLYHGKRVVNGWSGIVPPIYCEVIDKLLRFPSRDMIDFLRGMKVKYIILHRRKYDKEKWLEFTGNISRLEGIEFHKRFGEDFVFLLKPLKEEKPDLWFELMVPERIKAGTLRKMNAGFLILNKGRYGYANKPSNWLKVNAVWTINGLKMQPSKQTLPMPVFIGTGKSEPVLMKLNVPELEGKYVLEVNINGGFLANEIKFSEEIKVVKTGLPDSISPGRLEAEYKDFVVPESVINGDKLEVMGFIRNTGDTLWLSAGSFNNMRGRVSLGCVWYNEDGNELKVGGGYYELRAVLPVDISPGQGMWISMKYSVNIPPGKYKIRVSLVDEHIAWMPDIKQLPFREITVTKQ